VVFVQKHVYRNVIYYEKRGAPYQASGADVKHGSQDDQLAQGL
jgi:hypothetical protein